MSVSSQVEPDNKLVRNRQLFIAQTLGIIKKMISKKALKWIIIVFGLLYLIPTVFMKIVNHASDKASLDRVINEVNFEFKGIVLDKYSTRDVPPTHLKIKTENNNIIKISPDKLVVDNTSVGDSIIKVKSENLVYIKKSDSTISEFFYSNINEESNEN